MCSIHIYQVVGRCEDVKQCEDGHYLLEMLIVKDLKDNEMLYLVEDD